MSEIEIGRLADFAEGDYRVLAVGELEVGIFRFDGRIAAYENRCPHYGGPVCQGTVIPRVDELILADKTSKGLRFAKDHHVVCPWHGFEFSLETGCHPGDRNVRLKKVPLAIRDDRVFIEVP